MFSEPQARRGMWNGHDGGTAVEVEGQAVSTKRLRRPNVRLHQPYYEKPRHRKLQQQLKSFHKDLEVAKSNLVLKIANEEGNNNDEANDSINGDEMEVLSFDDDVVLGRWKDFNSCNRDKGYKSKGKRKREVPSGSKKRASVESNENDNKKDWELSLSSGGESEQQGEGDVVVEIIKDYEEQEQDLEENVGADGINNEFEPQNPDPSGSSSSGNDDGNDTSSNGNDKSSNGNDKSSADNNNVESNKVIRPRTMKGESEISTNGVRTWLNKMGLGKYAPIFEAHEVDFDVLPLLTLEDLKDMGISAVGSRRKLYNSIKNLNQGLF